MGYGLRVNVPVLVNASRTFDLVVNHYRAFNLETGPTASMDMMVYVPPQGRFSTFLELVNQLTSFAGSGTVLIVNHGSSDANDNPIGLILPLAAGSTWNPDEYTLGLLAGFISKSPSDKDYQNAESQSSMQTAAKQTVHMPAGTLKPLDTALRALRARKLSRLEIRACNLGGNVPVLKLLAQVLGVATIAAPKVHMFYAGSPAAPPPLSSAPAAFAHWKLSHARARVFTETPAANPRLLALQINGKHAARSADFNTTDVDVKWFIDQYVCPGSTYISNPSGKGARVKPFTFSGMDIANSFALNQEDAYADNLVEVTP